MASHEVSVRELRNNGGDVIDRVARGDRVVVTRSGRPVAELLPLARPALSREALVARWRRLPATDPDQLRADVDDLLDQSL